MKILIRHHPIDIYLLTGEEAREAREVAFGGHAEELVDSKPCFVTNSFGHDGFAWSRACEFESDYEMSFGPMSAESFGNETSDTIPSPFGGRGYFLALCLT